tara:strand:- start:4769 stop:5572 length:804 start_codon:yes stop_codon:yes gene_type:complete
MKIEELSLASLKYFLDAVELHSITQSAEKNHVSRPAVSQAIMRLEDWYGKTLLIHEKRNFGLTEDGKIFYRLAKQNFDNLTRGFLESKATNKSLRIGCSSSLIDFVFPKIQPFVNRSFQPVIKVGATIQLLNMLEQEQIHIAFLIEIQKDFRFKAIDLYEGSFELRSRNGKLGNVFITTERRPEIESFYRYASKNKIEFAQHIEVESWSAASRLAELMDATCLVPDYLNKGKLHEVNIKWQAPYKAKAIFQKESLLTELESELIQSF